MTKRTLLNLGTGATVALMALFASCSEDNPWMQKGSGFISPRLSATAEVKGRVSTRAEELEAPEASQFALTLSKTDGSLSRTWSSFTNFDTDEAFTVGNYVMEASYGDIDVEGLECPYFYGSAQFDVKEDQTTEVSITASLANSMVSFVYTDAFKKYFTDWNGTLHSEGGAYVTLPKEEVRPVYVKPGNISILLALTKQNGKSATYQPTDFKALPRHHYYVKFDVNGGEVGEGQLVITFDDTLEEDDVTIDLSDELFSAPAPEIIAKGFSFDSPLQMLEYSSPEAAMQYYIKAKSGIKEAKLTLKSSHSIPLGSEFDICSLSDMERYQLQEAGIKETGLSRNPGSLAQVDMTSLIGKLPQGEHEFTLVVKDKNMKVNDPVTLKVISSPLTLDVVSASPLLTGDATASLVLSFNGTDLASGLEIEAIDDYGAWKPCNISAITAKTSGKRTDAFPTKQYGVTFSLPSTTRDIQYRVKYSGVLKASGTLMRVFPEYTVSVDPYSRRAVIYVHSEDNAMISTIVGSLRVFAGSKELTVAARSVEKGYVIVSGLEPSTSYEIKTTLRTEPSPAFNDATTITTENGASVPNGDFETLVEKYNITDMKQGGQYRRTALGSYEYNTQSLNVSEPQYWATTNAKTLNTSASNQNSWFVIPSVFNSSLYFQAKTHYFSSGFGGETNTPAAYTWAASNGNNAMVIRNVAYDAAGTDPSKKGYSTATPSSYFNPNVPSIASKAVGKLFLGSYSYSNGSETYTEGIAFAARPTSLIGKYRYSTSGGASTDKGMVKIELLNGSDVIGTGYASLAANESDFGVFTVKITYTVAYKKATALRIMFASSEAVGTIPSETNAITTTAVANLHEQESRGSVLVVDNLVFNY